MPRFRMSGPVLILGLLAVRPVLAEESLFEKYAPLVWLASDERIYPMMPHPFAFDGIDNDLDGVYDLQDPKEIRMDEGDTRHIVDLVERLRGFQFTIDLEAAEEESLIMARPPVGRGEASMLQRGDYTQSIRQQKAMPEFSLREGRATDWLRNAFKEFGQPLPRLTAIRDGNVDAYWKVGTLNDSWWPRLGKLSGKTRDSEDLDKALRHLGAETEAPGSVAINLEICRGETLYTYTRFDADIGRKVDLYLDHNPEAHRVDVYGESHYEYSVEVNAADSRVTIRHASCLPPPRVTCALSGKVIKGRSIYEYWFYYLYDAGANAHHHDGEHAFLFVDDLGRVTAVVGTGHTDATPNNIVVASNVPRTDRLLPGSLPKHMPILVELGKHASAPDRAFDGKFDLGMDANMFYRDVWGSRDIAAASGVDQIRRVAPEFSFPRDMSTLIVNDRWQRAAIARNHAGYDAPDAAIMSEYRRVESAFAPDCDHYRLFPLDRMEDLMALLARDAGRDSVQDFLNAETEAFWGSPPQNRAGTLSEAGYEALLEWPDHMESNRELWLHKDHRDPSEVFKLWLFPKWAVGASAFAFGGDAYMRLSLDRSEFLIFKNSVIEAYADFDIAQDGVAFLYEDVGLNLRLFRGSHQGLYTGIGRGGGAHRRGFPYLTLGYVPFSWDLQAIPHVNVPRFLGHGQLSVFAEARGDIDTVDWPWSIDPFRAKIGLMFTRMVSGPKHPLDYARP